MEKESEYTFEMAQRLYFEEGRSIKEIANIMNVKESSIRTYISQERNVGINKPYKQIVKEEKERRARTGIRWEQDILRLSHDLLKSLIYLNIILFLSMTGKEIRS